MGYMPVDERAKCKFITCVAGMGLAGMGTCFLGGEWDNPECPKFKDEQEFIREHEEEKPCGTP
jgi:hypothetical protein